MTVLLMGGVYKFSKRAWRNFLEKWVADGDMPEIGRFATCVAVHAQNITDLGINDIQFMLEELTDWSQSQSDLKSRGFNEQNRRFNSERR